MRYLLVCCLLVGRAFAADTEESNVAPIDVAAVRPKAEAGDAKAQLEMGRAYYFGRGAKKDIQEATKWYRMASDQGNLEGQCAYAAVLVNSGSKKNARLGVELYRKAAEKGHPPAMFYLGTLYYTGTGVGNVAHDPFIGAEWYEKAAYAGVVAAQYNMGALLLNDNAMIKMNVIDGLAWLTIASEAGDKKAAEARTELLKEVKPGVVSAAQARMQEFKAEIERIKRAREQLAK